jgi:hypothetical protein
MAAAAIRRLLEIFQATRRAPRAGLAPTRSIFLEERTDALWLATNVTGFRKNRTLWGTWMAAA